MSQGCPSTSTTVLHGAVGVMIARAYLEVNSRVASIASLAVDLLEEEKVELCIVVVVVAMKDRGETCLACMWVVMKNGW